MEQIDPIVPMVFSNTVQIISHRVQNFTYAAIDSQMAYDQIWLKTTG
jgi:hypothetical protein